MSEYTTIKDLVIRTCTAEGKFPSYEKLTALVRLHFPRSKWKKTHYAWYKHQIKIGAVQVPGFPTEASEPPNDDDIENEVDESLEASVSLERDLHCYFASRVQRIEDGLKLVEDGVEYNTEAGDIDLLARDAENNLVVIELKAGKAKDAAIGQLLGYMGCLLTDSSKVRGILIASSFDPRTVYAAKGHPYIKLVKYQLSFSLQEVA
jgi:hypothetical protein